MNESDRSRHTDKGTWPSRGPWSGPIITRCCNKGVFPHLPVRLPPSSTRNCKTATHRIYSNVSEPSSHSLRLTVCNQVHIRIMPDDISRLNIPFSGNVCGHRQALHQRVHVMKRRRCIIHVSIFCCRAKRMARRARLAYYACLSMFANERLHRTDSPSLDWRLTPSCMYSRIRVLSNGCWTSCSPEPIVRRVSRGELRKRQI
ncbi:hypothetical protein BJV78DRAFT_1177506 [Lactifluus subvellereus]|nr:hypothetical protein BJV78DRAFT_1177506 [Lactifluus subvellereus]